LITAHTGCEDSPANTIASVLAASQAGADVVEIDLRTSGDGFPVLVHDSYLEGRGGARIHVPSRSYRELQSFAEQHTLELTPLEEILSEVRRIGCMLNIDLKDINSIDHVQQRIRSFGLTHNVIISGCSVDWAGEIAKEMSQLRVLLNVYSEDILSSPENRRTHMEDMVLFALEHGCCGINIDFEICTPDLVDFARKRFLPISVWTVDRREDMLNMLEMGVFAITTYHPALLSEMTRRSPAELVDGPNRALP